MISRRIKSMTANGAFGIPPAASKKRAPTGCVGDTSDEKLPKHYNPHSSTATSGSDVIQRLPDWLREPIQRHFPRFVDDVYIPQRKLPSMPEGVPLEEAFIFTVQNVFPCPLSLCEVPWKGYHVHHNNRTVVVLYDGNVYISCQKHQCQEKLAKERLRYYMLSTALYRFRIGNKSGAKSIIRTCSELTNSDRTYLRNNSKDPPRNACKVPPVQRMAAKNFYRTWVNLDKDMFSDYMSSMPLDPYYPNHSIKP